MDFVEALHEQLIRKDVTAQLVTIPAGEVVDSAEILAWDSRWAAGGVEHDVVWLRAGGETPTTKVGDATVAVACVEHGDVDVSLVAQAVVLVDDVTGGVYEQEQLRNFEFDTRYWDGGYRLTSRVCVHDMWLYSVIDYFVVSHSHLGVIVVVVSSLSPYGNCVVNLDQEVLAARCRALGFSR